jgi:hypothetical protein
MAQDPSGHGYQHPDITMDPPDGTLLLFIYLPERKGTKTCTQTAEVRANPMLVRQRAARLKTKESD